MTQPTLINHPLGAVHAWTGRLIIDLRDPPTFSGTTLEAKVTRDAVELWFHERSAAFMERDHFREWLVHPAERSLTFDSVVWSVQRGTICVTIHQTETYAVTSESIEDLWAVI